MQDLKVTADNYTYSYLEFGDRQAGVGLVYSPEEDRYFYNVYCLERTLLKELMSVEFEFLEDALESLTQEFGSWSLKELEEKKSGCSTCVAK